MTTPNQNLSDSGDLNVVIQVKINERQLCMGDIAWAAVATENKIRQTKTFNNTIEYVFSISLPLNS